MRDSMTQKVYRITNADSLQKIKMKPAIDKASKMLEALRADYQTQEMRVLDSLSLQVKPFLREDQSKSLTDMKAKGGRKW